MKRRFTLSILIICLFIILQSTTGVKAFEYSRKKMADLLMNSILITDITEENEIGPDWLLSKDKKFHGIYVISGSIGIGNKFLASTKVHYIGDEYLNSGLSVNFEDERINKKESIRWQEFHNIVGITTMQQIVGNSNTGQTNINIIVSEDFLN